MGYDFGTPFFPYLLRRYMTYLLEFPVLLCPDSAWFTLFLPPFMAVYGVMGYELNYSLTQRRTYTFPAHLGPYMLQKL